jgi:hypothetical protein
MTRLMTISQSMGQLCQADSAFLNEVFYAILKSGQSFDPDFGVAA